LGGGIRAAGEKQQQRHAGEPQQSKPRGLPVTTWIS
jgi:hypothetical protein